MNSGTDCPRRTRSMDDPVQPVWNGIWRLNWILWFPNLDAASKTKLTSPALLVTCCRSAAAAASNTLLNLAAFGLSDHIPDVPSHKAQGSSDKSENP